MTIWLSWSSGKDSAWTLHRLRQEGRSVAALFTTVNQAFDRVAMHGVRRDLLEAQAAAAGLPLVVIDLPWPCSNADYERIMAEFMVRAKRDGVTHMAFGDLFLEDIRAYREKNLAGSGIAPLFPLWGLATDKLAQDMVSGGLTARLATIDLAKLDRTFAGRCYDAALLRELPAGIDPCGENGEFHTFVTGGPMFSRSVAVVPGEVVTREGFAYADLVAESYG
ncbi:MAG: adenine nucleotide alpha hydrolase [Hyphomicrobiaceae bacterium]|nr:adenine nucleotide alpha hydrolase [Hyphomicrobiaceae bacterium]